LAEDIMDWIAVGDKLALVSDGCVGPPVYLDNMIPMACVSRYPAEPNDYDLDLYSGKWGLSDHTLGASLAFDAREKGATYFEKHVDFFKGEGLDTPDSPVSVDGQGFGLWAAGIRSCSVSAPPAKKYGRVKKDGGWYRPWPEGE
jgi:sialic acid synthase SpsE